MYIKASIKVDKKDDEEGEVEMKDEKKEKIIRWLAEPVSSHGTPPNWLYYCSIIMSIVAIVISIKRILK